MKALLTTLLSVILILTLCFHTNAQTPAWERVEKIEKGYNLSGWLEAGWLQENYPDPTAYTEDELILFAQLGFKTVRVPVLYEWIITEYPPYDTIVGQSIFDIIDNTIIPTAEEYGLTVILDNHHGRELTNTNFEDEIPRICGQWKFLTQYYANLPHDRYFFELRHESSDDISNENLRIVQQAVIDTIRTYDTERTLILGANWWSAPWSLAETIPYNDDNIIYTFHTYDPYNFTHQGLGWIDPILPAATFSATDPGADSLQNSLIMVKDWSETHNVPVFWGEFGVSWFADAESRCNYIEFTTEVSDQLDIPWIYWDITNIGGAFGIFESSVIHQDSIIPCFRDAMELYTPVLPGDFNNDNIVTVTDVMYMRQAQGNEGLPRPDSTIDYMPQPALDWNVEVYGVNGKHQDGNGDGIVDEDDLEALRQNYCMDCDEVQLQGNSNFNVVHRDTIVEGEPGHIYEIYIENLPTASGVSFRLDYGLFGIMQHDIIIDIENSWLEPSPNDTIWVHDTNLQRIDVAISSIDNYQQENNGQPVVYIVTVEDVLKYAPNQKFEVSNGVAATTNEIAAIIGEVATTAKRLPTTTGRIVGISNWKYIPPPLPDPHPHPDIDVYPNPAYSKSNLNIQLREETWTGKGDLIIMDIHGRIITNQQVNIHSGKVIDPIDNLHKLESGIYLVRLQSEEWKSKPQKLMYLH